MEPAQLVAIVPGVSFLPVDLITILKFDGMFRGDDALQWIFDPPKAQQQCEHLVSRVDGVIIDSNGGDRVARLINPFAWGHRIRVAAQDSGAVNVIAVEFCI